MLFVLSRPGCVQQCSRPRGVGGSKLFYGNQCRSCVELHEDFCVHCHKANLMFSTLTID